MRSLPITRGEIDAALAAEFRLWARKRLIAIRALIEGQSQRAAARAARTDADSVRVWIEQVREGGCAGLLRRARTFRATPDQDLSAAREIKAALSHEDRPWAHCRLAAVHALLSGQSVQAASRAAGTAPANVHRWLKRLRSGGLSALLRNDNTGPVSALRMTKGDIAAARRQIEAALARKLPQPLRKRLIAIRAVLGGQSLAMAARTAGVSQPSVSRWFSQMRREGWRALLHDARLRVASVRSPANPGFAGSPATGFTLPITHAEIAAALASESRAAVRKRLLAVQRVLCGDNITDAARATKTKPSTLLRWLRLVQQSGCEVLLRDDRRAVAPQVITSGKALLPAKKRTGEGAPSHPG
jgi:transposase